MGLFIFLIPSRLYNPFPLSNYRPWSASDQHLKIKMHKKRIFWDLLRSFGIFHPETKRNDFFIGYPKRNDFLKKRIFTFLETFGNKIKKQKFKKRKRPKNIPKNGNKNVVSTISAWSPIGLHSLGNYLLIELFSPGHISCYFIFVATLYHMGM